MSAMKRCGVLSSGARSQSAPIAFSSPMPTLAAVVLA
jgi:hypothetical protein